jgi:hypothetical protein
MAGCGRVAYSLSFAFTFIADLDASDVSNTLTIFSTSNCKLCDYMSNSRPRVSSCQVIVAAYLTNTLPISIATCKIAMN